MTARTRKPCAPAAVSPPQLPQLFAITDASGAFAMSVNGHVMAWTDRASAESEVGGGGRVVPLIAVTPAPPRETAWGPGQFDDLRINPNAKVSLRVTDVGRLLMAIPGGCHDITEISSSLGTGLHEAGARAAQIRARIAERAARRTSR